MKKLKLWYRQLITKFGLFCLTSRAHLIESLDPDRITVKEIAKFFFFPKFLAKLVLNQGVRDGKFSLNHDGTYKYLG